KHETGDDSGVVVAPVNLPIHTTNGAAKRVQPGMNIDPRNLDAGNPNPAELLDAGVTWVRFVFKNCDDAQLPGDLSFYETVVYQLRQAGIKVLMVINNESCPGRPTLEEHHRNRNEWQRLSVWQPYLEKFGVRCRTLAERFAATVSAFQIWNEPDLDPAPGYDPTLDPQIYGPLLRKAYQAIKAVSDAKVITAGFVRSTRSEHTLRRLQRWRLSPPFLVCRLSKDSSGQWR
ncbi:MAG: hypothetical protein KDD84_13795, partial [Caldilineaceae bacterium]|nr:hypothetical protein [Caldilineaceae bacterium]